MSQSGVFAFFVLSALLILAFAEVVIGAAVRDDVKPENPPGAAKQVFMTESDASSFFRRRTQRSTRYYAELQAEQREKRAVSERHRERNEEQRNEYENYVEEDRNGKSILVKVAHRLLQNTKEKEINERIRAISEQLREHHYDGLQPRSYWFH